MPRKLVPLVKKDVSLNLITPDKPRLALIGGSKKAPGDDWLSELPEGSQFLVKAIKPIGQTMPSSFMLQFGEVVKVIKRARVIRMTQGGQSAEMPVDPKAFCETFELFETTEDISDEPSNS